MSGEDYIHEDETSDDYLAEVRENMAGPPIIVYDKPGGTPLFAYRCHGWNGGVRVATAMLDGLAEAETPAGIEVYGLLVSCEHEDFVDAYTEAWRLSNRTVAATGPFREVTNRVADWHLPQEAER